MNNFIMPLQLGGLRTWTGQTGTSGPTGDNQVYIEPNFATLDALPGLNNGDFGITEDNGFIYVYDTGVWFFYRGIVETVAELPSGDIAATGVCSVGTGSFEDATQYAWDGSAWQRSPSNRPYARTLSSLQDVLVTDLDGDYGLFGGTTLRLKRSISLPGGGTANLWLPPVIYAGTITMRAYALGTESNTGLSTTLANQGWTLVTAGSSTISATGSDIQLQSQGGGGSCALRTLVAGMASGTQLYVQVDLAGTLGASGNITLYTSDGTSLGYFSQNNVGSSGLWIRANSSSADAIANQYRNGAATALPTIASGNRTVFQFHDQGAVMGTSWRDGQMYQALRKNFTAGNFGNFYNMGIATGAGSPATTVTYRNLYVLTWV